MEFKSKILTVNELKSVKEVYSNSKIAFTNGCFDLLHSGHINLFKFCKEKGDIVIVGLNSDASIQRLKGSSRPIQSIDIRKDILSSIEYIDYIIEVDDDLTIKTCKIHNYKYTIITPNDIVIPPKV